MGIKYQPLFKTSQIPKGFKTDGDWQVLTIHQVSGSILKAVLFYAIFIYNNPVTLNDIIRKAERGNGEPPYMGTGIQK